MTIKKVHEDLTRPIRKVRAAAKLMRSGFQLADRRREQTSAESCLTLPRSKIVFAATASRVALLCPSEDDRHNRRIVTRIFHEPI
jgi:hypothetical protein